MSAHVAPLKLYAGVFAGLMVLTSVTVAVAYLDLGRLNTPIALGIACFKAGLVVLYFMHLRWSSRLAKLFFLAGIFWFGILIVLLLGDYDTRSWMEP
jgi:cytochrome c oxidase subunit 4